MFSSRMSRFILSILLVISTCVVVAHGYLAYQFNAPQTLIAEEESHDEKPAAKETKELGQDKFLFGENHDKNLTINITSSTEATVWYSYSRGFWDAPYNPPEGLVDL